MNTAIIGAGMTGLTAGYRLLKKGHSTAIFEAQSRVGGLCAGFKEKGWSWSLDTFYHHFFTSDHTVLKLARELGQGGKVFFLKPVTSVVVNGRIFPADSARRWRPASG